MQRLALPWINKRIWFLQQWQFHIIYTVNVSPSLCLCPRMIVYLNWWKLMVMCHCIQGPLGLYILTSDYGLHNHNLFLNFFIPPQPVARVHVDFVVFLNWTLAPVGWVSIATFSLICYWWGQTMRSFTFSTLSLLFHNFEWKGYLCECELYLKMSKEY